MDDIQSEIHSDSVSKAIWILVSEKRNDIWSRKGEYDQLRELLVFTKNNSPVHKVRENCFVSLTLMIVLEAENPNRMD